MTISSMPVTAGDIWLAYVEFADHPGIGKVRPVIVLSQLPNGSVEALKVTTKTTATQMGGTLVRLADWPSEGLRKPSYARTDLVLDLPASALLNDSPIGFLSAGDATNVLGSFAR